MVRADMYIALSEEEKTVIKSMTQEYAHISEISNIAHMGIGTVGFARLVDAGLVKHFPGDNMFRLTRLGQIAKDQILRGEVRFRI